MSVRGDQPRLLIYPRSGQGISGGWLGATTSNYSYVKVAVDTYKYSTLSWDRLGIGMSSHGDPIQEIQASLEVAALYALMQKLREGSINGVECKFTKVVHIGHSFGSVLTYTLAARNPEASNGLVLTGFAQNGSFIPYFALGSNFVQAETIESLKESPHGYLAPGDEAAVEVVFFARRMFDHSILNLAYLKREPVAVGELLTIGGDLAGVSRFKGPVFVTTGSESEPECRPCNLISPQLQTPRLPAFG